LLKMKNRLRRETDWMRQGIKARGTRAKSRVDGFLSLKNKVDKVRQSAKSQMQMHIDASKRKTKKLIEFKELDFSYEEKDLFKALDLLICKKDRIGLLGKNGSGKSTMAKLVTGELHAQGGELKRAEDLTIEYFEQKKTDLSKYNNAAEFLGEGEEFLHLANGQRKHVVAYLEDFHFHRDDAYRPLIHFSGGERARLQLAKNLSKSADLWIFDEPTNDLDFETLEVLEKCLTEFEGALILISHDRSFLENVTNKVWWLKPDGVQTFDTGYEHVAPYIQSLALDDGQANEKEDSGKKNKKEKIKLSNKDKMRAKTIDRDIKNLESDLEKRAKEVENFDFSGDSTGYEKLTSKMAKVEEEILELYELKEKING
jgi:ATP-binding cassette subfamily F protein uup